MLFYKLCRRGGLLLVIFDFHFLSLVNNILTALESLLRFASMSRHGRRRRRVL